MRTAAAGLDCQGIDSISFDDMGADLHALYSGKDVTITVKDLGADLQALYGSTVLPVAMSDLLAELRELYGDAEVRWQDLAVDLEALYDVHAA